MKCSGDDCLMMELDYIDYILNICILFVSVGLPKYIL